MNNNNNNNKEYYIIPHKKHYKYVSVLFYILGVICLLTVIAVITMVIDVPRENAVKIVISLFFGGMMSLYMGFYLEDSMYIFKDDFAIMQQQKRQKACINAVLCSAIVQLFIIASFI